MGFLRNYAEYLGLDAEELIGIYRNIKIQEQPLPMNELLVSRPRLPSMRVIMIVIAAVLILAAVGFLVYRAASRGRPSTSAAPEGGPRANADFVFQDEVRTQWFNQGDGIAVPIGGKTYRILVVERGRHPGPEGPRAAPWRWGSARNATSTWREIPSLTSGSCGTTSTLPRRSGPTWACTAPAGRRRTPPWRQRVIPRIRRCRPSPPGARIPPCAPTPSRPIVLAQARAGGAFYRWTSPSRTTASSATLWTTRTGRTGSSRRASSSPSTRRRSRSRSGSPTPGRPACASRGRISSWAASERSPPA